MKATMHKAIISVSRKFLRQGRIWLIIVVIALITISWVIDFSMIRDFVVSNYNGLQEEEEIRVVNQTNVDIKKPDPPPKPLPLSHDIFDLSYAVFTFHISRREQYKAECDIPEEYKELIKMLCWDDHSCAKIPCHLLTPQLQVVTLYDGRTCNSRGDLLGITPHSNVLFAPSNLLHASDEMFAYFNRARFPESRNATSSVPLLSSGNDTNSENATYAVPLWLHNLNFESISYYPHGGDPAYLSKFNFSMGNDPALHQIHTVPFLMGTVNGYLNMENRTFITMHVNKTEEAAISMLISNCDDRSGRLAYISKLMEYMPVHSFGHCLHNKEHDSHISTYEPGFFDYKMDVMSHYHFGVAFENSVDKGWITEKLWQVIIAGSIPLYYGAPDIYDYLPDPDCIINVKDFSGPEDLSKYLKRVLAEPELYRKHKAWLERPWSENFQRALELPRSSPEQTLCEATYTWPNLTRIHKVLTG